jgi:hypothetical protein
MKIVSKWLLATIGVVVLVFGAIQVAIADSASGAVALVIAGGVLLISSLVIDRVEKLSVGTQGLELRLTRAIAELGAPHKAAILEGTDLGSFAESYAFIHEELGGEHREVKVYLQDLLLVERSAAVARRLKVDASEARRLFQNGSPMMRVLALGLMEGNSSLADGATITSAITESRSANEQYHGLKLAQLSWRQLSKSERMAIRAAIADDPSIKDGTDRKRLAEDLLTRPTD